MTDQIETDRLARVTSAEAVRLAEVEAEQEIVRKREYNRVKKAESRQREKEARQREVESQPGYRERTDNDSREKASARMLQEQRSQELLIVGELIEPIQADTILEDGESYWATVVQPDIEAFIDRTRRFACGSWESFYFWMSETRAGQKILEFYGVKPLDFPRALFPDNKFYLNYVSPPEGGQPIPTFLNLSPEERQAVVALKEVWERNRKDKKDWRPQ